MIDTPTLVLPMQCCEWLKSDEKAVDNSGVRVKSAIEKFALFVLLANLIASHF